MDHIRVATIDDIEAIRAIEQTPAYRLLISSWTHEQHQALLPSPDARYLVAVGVANQVAGFAILRGLTSEHRSAELVRLAVTEPNRGHGRRLLQAVLHIAFDEHKAHRLWLDVYEGNPHARHIYLAAGFRVDGIFRESIYLDGAFHSMLLMSIVEDEYRAASPKTPWLDRSGRVTLYLAPGAGST